MAPSAGSQSLLAWTAEGSESGRTDLTKYLTPLRQLGVGLRKTKCLLSSGPDARLWPKAEIEMPSEPVRVAPDLAEVFTSAMPTTRDVILVGGMVGNRPTAVASKMYD